MRERNACCGCRRNMGTESDYRLTCRIKNCEQIADGKAKYCFRCDRFPCAVLKRLDKRYRTKYGMSMIENLERIRDMGIRRFIRGEKEKWACRQCGALICVHKPQCPSCGHAWRRGQR